MINRKKWRGAKSFAKITMRGKPDKIFECVEDVLFSMNVKARIKKKKRYVKGKTRSGIDGTTFHILVNPSIEEERSNIVIYFNSTSFRGKPILKDFIKPFYNILCKKTQLTLPLETSTIYNSDKDIETISNQDIPGIVNLAAIKQTQYITFSVKHRQILEEYAQSELPDEAGAFLLGRVDSNNTIVTGIFLTEGISKSPTKFEWGTQQMNLLFMEAEKLKTSVVGFFHSHPCGVAYPSGTDKKFMRHHDGVMAIYSDINMTFRAFVLGSEVQVILVP